MPLLTQCPSCRTDNPEHSKFCQCCGCKLPPAPGAPRSASMNRVTRAQVFAVVLCPLAFVVIAIANNFLNFLPKSDGMREKDAVEAQTNGVFHSYSDLVGKEVSLRWHAACGPTPDATDVLDGLYGSEHFRQRELVFRLYPDAVFLDSKMTLKVLDFKSQKLKVRVLTDPYGRTWVRESYGLDLSDDRINTVCWIKTKALDLHLQ
jgi:hypothetical protein